jgi:hypothetical protein
MTENLIGKYITDAAIEVHRTPGGSGLLESAYKEAINLGAAKKPDYSSSIS